MAQDPNELVANPAVQQLNLPVDVQVDRGNLRMQAQVVGGGEPSRRGNGGNLGLLAVLFAALAAVFAGMAAFKPAGVSQPALESALSVSSGELAKQLAKVVVDSSADIKVANDKFATNVAGKVGEEIGAVFVKETETRHAELVTKVDAVATKVDGVAAGQAETTKLVKSLRWHVRKAAESAAARPAETSYRSVTVVAPDGQRHTISLRDY